eukprot:CAMPEP_0167741472 /NCGR_PEP_ID=MMETSP0110_2-20121227/877_1 /TAXON_ID=629695 /ORGANISM="Gymnochlora sp., Strain CCMP2014" /LENGTH=494 /DNA_ID=CAMNT_0007625531 /DNA_START=2668 /DNA_END=4152 /DNA_ORIENTATION=+
MSFGETLHRPALRTSERDRRCSQRANLQMSSILGIVLISVCALFIPNSSKRRLGYSPEPVVEGASRWSSERRTLPEHMLQRRGHKGFRPIFDSFTSAVGGGISGRPAYESTRDATRTGKAFAKAGGASGDAVSNKSTSRTTRGRPAIYYENVLRGRKNVGGRSRRDSVPIVPNFTVDATKEDTKPLGYTKPRVKKMEISAVVDPSAREKIEGMLRKYDYPLEVQQVANVSNASFAQSEENFGQRISGLERPWVCNVCNRRFMKRGHLMTHRFVHESQGHTCNICNRTFNFRFNLVRHLKMHSGLRPYVCTVCKHAFNLKGNLQIHFRVHTKMKPFACRICHKRFTMKQNRDTHLRLHTGEKPFNCTVCGKQFSLKVVLENHLRSVHERHKCEACGIEVASWQALLDHKTKECKSRVFNILNGQVGVTDTLIREQLRQLTDNSYSRRRMNNAMSFLYERYIYGDKTQRGVTNQVAAEPLRKYQRKVEQYTTNQSV